MLNLKCLIYYLSRQINFTSEASSTWRTCINMKRQWYIKELSIVQTEKKWNKLLNISRNSKTWKTLNKAYIYLIIKYKGIKYILKVNKNYNFNKLNLKVII